MILFALIAFKANFNFSILRMSEKFKKTKFDYTFIDYLKLYNPKAKLS